EDEVLGDVVGREARSLEVVEQHVDIGRAGLEPFEREHARRSPPPQLRFLWVEVEATMTAGRPEERLLDERLDGPGGRAPARPVLDDGGQRRISLGERSGEGGALG